MKKHHLHKLGACICSAVLAGTVFCGAMPLPLTAPAVVYAASDDDLILRYDTSAGNNNSGNAWDNDESFYKALPVGNGHLGAMVYGNCPTERFDLNDATFWSGGPASNNRNVSNELMERAWQQMLAGNYRDADGTIGNNMIGGGMAKYQSVGTLLLDFGHRSVGGYSRWLDMNTAVAGCSYTCDGKTYKRETFVSYPDQVMVTRITCDSPGGISMSAGYDCSLKDQYTVETDGNDTLVMNGHGDSVDYGARFAVWFSTRTKVIPDGGSVSAGGGKVSVSNADSVVILTSVRTNFIDYATCNGDEKGKASSDIASASKKSYDELYANHLADYQELFQRVDVELGGNGSENATPIPSRIANFGRNNDPKLVEVLFQYGRYMMISASRDSEPMNLQGIWNKFRDPAWGCKYTTNINYEMNYWPAMTTNLEECFRPFVEKAKSLQAQGNKTAKEVYGVSDGWVVHHNTDIWNQTGPIDGAWGMWPTGAAWISNMLYDAYRFNQDEEYLQEIYPVIEGSAQFLNAIMRDAKIDGQTYSVVFPSTSPEVNTPGRSGGQGAACAYGITMDNGMTRELFGDVIEASEHLKGANSFADTLRSKINLIKPDTIGSWGQIQEWAYDWDDKGEKNRHISHMYNLYPGSNITKTETAQMAAAAGVSLNARGDDGTGWSEAWKLNCWARMEDGAHAYNIVKLLVSPVNNYGRLYDNLWDAHPPFQIDGNFGFTSGVTEMLMQSHNDEIKLIPALPEQWSTGHANGLCARGGFTVNEAWENGALVSAEIYSKSGNVCTVSYQGQTVSFPTEKGKTYQLDGMLELSDSEIGTLRNVARNKTATSDSGDAKAAVDGSEGTAWKGDSSSKTVEVDLGKTYNVCRWVTKFAGVGGEYKENARSFTVSLSTDGKTWTTVDAIDGNTKNICENNITPTEARYARIQINNPSQLETGVPSINEFEVWGVSDDPEPTRSAYDNIEAESFDRQYGIQTEVLDDGGMDVGYIQNGDYIAFRRMDFGPGANGFEVKAGSETEGGKISIRLDSPTGKEVGSCTITGTEGWTEWKNFTCDVSGASGIHTVYLVFEGDDGFLMNVDSFKFTTDMLTGDINQDGKVDDADLIMMQKHLLTIKPLTAAQGPLADINGDGKITAIDLSLLKQILLK